MAGNTQSQIVESFYSRGQAAEVLRKVADCIEGGLWPEGITIKEVGTAISRAVDLYESHHDLEEGSLDKLLQGYFERHLRF